MGLLGGASKTEHYEIASYTDLVQMAKDLGEPEAARLLKENLDQEKAMSKQLETLSKAVGQGLQGQWPRATKATTARPKPLSVEGEGDERESDEEHTNEAVEHQTVSTAPVHSRPARHSTPRYSPASRLFACSPPTFARS